MKKILIPPDALEALLSGISDVSAKKFIAGRYNGVRLGKNREFVGHTASKSYYSSNAGGRDLAEETLEEGGFVYERDHDGTVWEVTLGESPVPPRETEYGDYKQAAGRLKRVPWWERHYALDTRVCAPACAAPLPAPQEIPVGLGRADRRPSRVTLWHELAAAQEAQRREEVLELRRFVRRDITGMSE